MSEVLSMVAIDLFIMIIGFVMLYISFKRSAVVWSIIAAIPFGTNILYSGTIPFQTDASGAVIGTSANYLLTGINLLFCFLSLAFAVYYAFLVLKGGEVM